MVGAVSVIVFIKIHLARSEGMQRIPGILGMCISHKFAPTIVQEISNIIHVHIHDELYHRTSSF